MKTMRAIRVDSPGQITLCEAPVPEPAADEALVAVRYVGICGTDIHAYRGSHPFLTYPRILGHEIAGHVEVPPSRPPAGSQPLRSGDPVIVEPYINCNRCHMCLSDRYNACLNLQVLGVHRDGGMAEYVSVRADRIHKVPDGLDLSRAVLTEPLSVGAHAVRRSGIDACNDRSVLVIGAGPIGLAAVAACRLQDARVAVTDLIESRLERARALGAELCLRADDREELAKALLEWTAGIGPRCVIEAVGLPETIQQACLLVRAGGTVVLVGMTNRQLNFATNIIMAKELDIYASRNSLQMFGHILQAMLTGRIDPEPFISHIVDLEQVPDLIPDMARKPADYLKVLVKVD